MKEITPNPKRAEREGKHAEDRSGEVSERFSFVKGVALHPAAAQRGGETKTGAEHATEQPVGKRAVEEHPGAGRPRRRQCDDYGLAEADENPAEDSRAKPNHQATEWVRPSFARRLGNSLAHEIFPVRVLDANLGAVARLAQEEDHAAERGDEHLTRKTERGNEHRDGERQPDGGRGVERNGCGLPKADPVDGSRNECGEDL